MKRGLLALMVALLTLPVGPVVAQEEADGVGVGVGESFEVDAPAHGPGITFDLCQYFSADDAALLIGTAVQQSNHFIDWVSGCSFPADSDIEVLPLAELTVTDYGTAEQAINIFQSEFVLADFVDVPGLGDRAAWRTNDLVTDLFVQKGQFVIKVGTFNAQAKPGPELMVPIAARVLPAL